MTHPGVTAIANWRGAALSAVAAGPAAPEAGVGMGHEKALIGAVAATGLPPLAATRPTTASTTGATSASRPEVSISASVASLPSDRSITARVISPPAIFSTSSSVISRVPRSGSADFRLCCRRPSKNVLMSGS